MADRFIPQRRNMDLEITSFKLKNDIAKTARALLLDQHIFDGSIFSSILPIRKPKKNMPRPLKPISPYESIGNISVDMVMAASGIYNEKYCHNLGSSSTKFFSLALETGLYVVDSDTRKYSQIYSDVPNIGRTISSALSFDSKIVIGGHMNGDLHMYDVSQNKYITSFCMPKPAKAITKIAFKDEFSYVLVDSGGAIILVDTRQQKGLVIDCLDRPICNFEWNPDQSRLATSDDSGIVRIYDVRKNESLCRIDNDSEPVKGLSWNPVDTSLLSMGGRNIYTWNIDTKKELTPIETELDAHDLHWISQKHLLSIHDNTGIVIWNAKTQMPCLKDDFLNENEKSCSVVLGQNKKLIVSIEDEIVGWNLSNLKMAAMPKEERNSMLVCKSLR